MDREALRTYLTREYAELIAEAGIDLEPILDAVAQVYTVTTDLVLVWAEPLGDYYLLRRAKRALVTAFDIGVEGDSYRLNQLYKNVEAELAMAEARVSWLVIPGVEDGPKFVTLNTPFLSDSWSSVTGYGEW